MGKIIHAFIFRGDEMPVAITTFSRREKKYVISQEQKEQLIQKIEEYMQYDAYCEHGKHYRICNLYFDDSEYSMIRRSILYSQYKEKVRLRSYYTNAKDESITFLEIKKKFLGMVNKRRILLPLIEAEQFLYQGITPSHLTIQQKQILKEISYILDRTNVTPRVYLSYERLAFFGKEDRSVRLTIDRNIVARTDDITLRSHANGEFILKENEYLVEIKVGQAIPLWLSKILCELGIYSSSFSKYGKFYEQKIKGDVVNV